MLPVLFALILLVPLAPRTHYPDWQPGAAGQEMIDRLAGFQLQCLRKDAEIVAASTAAAVAVAASAGQGGSHWGQSTGKLAP